MKKIFLLLPLFLLLPGCFLQSLKPHYTPESKVDLPAAHGEWFFADADTQVEKETPWVWSEDRIVGADEKKQSIVLACAYFKVQENYFVDFTVDEKKLDGLEKVFVRPVHMLYKVIIKDDTMSLLPLRYEWFKQQREAGKIPLSYAGNDDTLIAASSEEWMQFLSKEGNNPQVFSENDKRVFQRNKPANEKK